MKARTNRRELLAHIGAAVLAAATGTTSAQQSPAARVPSAGALCQRARFPRMGAIRWDAWYDRNSAPGKATEAALSPERYHFRLPFFARVKSSSSVEIDGNHQATMDREIALAADAGLSYWAFNAYQPTSSMSNGLRLYLNSRLKRRIQFCMLESIDTWGDARILDWHIELMREPSYQTVLGQRPLYYLGFLNDAVIANHWGGMPGLRLQIQAFSQRIRSIGRDAPYIVILDPDAVRAAAAAKAIGADAIGCYAVNSNPPLASFSDLVRETEVLWQQDAATGLGVVPLVTTGFDRRPRMEHPSPWEDPLRGSLKDNLRIYYETASPGEIARELRDCLRFISEHATETPARVALIYAWNENDEGGWLIPTYRFNRERLDATKSVLCSPHKLPMTASIDSKRPP